ncbi:MAG: hypothetical protein ACKPKO_03820, partial [Candidatus Fonsibacter sp.]
MMQSMHSSWFVSPVATTIFSGLLSQYLDSRQVPHGADEDLVEDDGIVDAVVELSHLGPFCEPYAEEFIEGAVALLVVVGEAVRGADEQDLVPSGLHGLAGVALAAAAVLRSY